MINTSIHQDQSIFGTLGYDKHNRIFFDDFDFWALMGKFSNSWSDLVMLVIMASFSPIFRAKVSVGPKLSLCQTGCEPFY